MKKTAEKTIRWGMVIDLRKCIGCKACVNACKAAHQNNWKKVYDCGITGFPERLRTFLHLSCMHCSNPPCLAVCPTAATYKREDGIVDIDHDLCAGCGYCIVACPYHARSIYSEEHDFEVNELTRKTGTRYAGTALGGLCTKCDFCKDRIDSGMALGLTPGVDPDASPLCMVSCSTGAISFGDLSDPDALPARLIRDNRTSRLQEDFGSDPSVYFIVE
jgi:phenylacetyl-CoA:acceptor oxidoreductase subunit 1